MIVHIKQPTVLRAAGSKPKAIEEFIGRVNTGTTSVSIARMRSPEGWIEPGQRPDFDEYTVVLSGTLRVTTDQEEIDVRSGEAVIVPRGERVRYGTPEPGGAEYLAICVPAFSPDAAHRDPK